MSSLGHGQANELVLSTLGLFTTASIERLQGVQCGSSTEVVGARLFIASTATVQLFVLSDGIIFINFFVLQLVFIASEQTKGQAEEVGIA